MKPFGSSPLVNRGSSRRFQVASLLLALLVSGCPLALGNKGGHDNSSPGSSATPGPKFDVPIPVNHDARGVELPYFDSHGKLQMFFTIQKAFRADVNHLRMKNAFMQTYDEKGVPDADVFMTSSVLDLNTRIVTSDVPVTVRRSDFTIVGKNMVFNTQTRRGQMSGHVQMVVYNRQDMAQSSPSPSPSSSAAPNGSAAPNSSAGPKPSVTPQ